MEQGKGENYPRKGKWNIELPWDNQETKIGRLNSEEGEWQGEGLTPEKQLTLNQGFLKIHMELLLLKFSEIYMCMKGIQMELLYNKEDSASSSYLIQLSAISNFSNKEHLVQSLAKWVP